ncbi:MAG: enoyl-CoA hydratase/isomerase family protein [Immundisolibacter sp.]|uniref:enoyl-CoA hydratase/isomerase family protein n=1 Tax=Immundisolibacter sp. TaxID=1934948 RepID=UPI0019AABD28|nr:enoyl-CoA hydratase-related protein [Immundisolibacter sp.]MBC7162997.1 enoyl-CoA hydratase/isomerase family protein [Immundisolibacter sp.]
METITYAVDGAVATITLNRPQVRNAMNGRMIEELRQTLEAVNLDTGVRVLVLRGAGPVFCAGGDLRDLFTDTHPVAIRNLIALRIRPLSRALITLDKPLVCALQGPVAGAGLAMALAADFVIATEEASFVTAFGKIGAIPDAGVMWLLAQHVGLMRAKDIVLRAKTLTAAQALDLGIYTEVVPKAGFDDAVNGLVAELAEGATLAMTFAKHALRDAVRMPFDAFMDLESAGQGLMHASHDHHEGVQAFLEKRAPRFTGR